MSIIDHDLALRAALDRLRTVVNETSVPFLTALGYEVAYGKNADALRGALMELEELYGHITKLSTRVERIYAPTRQQGM